jgi:uncharacterized protein (TIGR00369 family)
MEKEEVWAAVEHAVRDVESGPSFLHRFLDLKMSYIKDLAVVEFQSRKYLANRKGALHGGIIALVLDMAMGALHRNAIGPGLTLEFKVQFMKGVDTGRLRCESRFLKQGRRLSFMEARAIDEADDLVALATATWQAVGQPAENAK